MRNDPSSEPVRIIGNSGWYDTAVTFCACPIAEIVKIDEHNKVWVRTFECLDTCFILIIPNFDHSIVGTRNEVRFVTADIIVDTVDTFFVSFQRKVWLVGAELPNF